MDNAATMGGDGDVCSISEMQLFENPPVQIVVDSNSVQFIRSDGALSNAESPIRLRFVSDVEHYIDLSQSMLFAEVKVTKADGTDFGAGIDVAPVNLFLHSLFSQVDVMIGSTVITSGLQTHAYLAYLQTILSYGAAAKGSWLKASGYYKDHHHRMEDTTVIEKEDAVDKKLHNPGLADRHFMISSSRRCQMIGRLHNGLFAMNKLMLPGVPITLTFHRSKKEFSLIKSAEVVDVPKIELTDFGVFVKLVKVADREQMNVEDTLMDTPALYPFTRSEVLMQSLATGDKSVTKNNLIIGRLPKRVVIGFVTDKASTGDFLKNPYNFQHFGLNRLALEVNNETEPKVPLVMDFTNDKTMQSRGAIRAYMRLFGETGRLFDDSGLDITPSDFHGGTALYVFDLTPTSAGGCVNPSRNGTLSVHAAFDVQLAETVNMVVYAEWDSQLTIDGTRAVTKNF